MAGSPQAGDTTRTPGPYWARRVPPRCACFGHRARSAAWLHVRATMRQTAPPAAPHRSRLCSRAEGTQGQRCKPHQAAGGHPGQRGDVGRHEGAALGQGGAHQQRNGFGAAVGACRRGRARRAARTHALQRAGMLPARDQFLARKGDKQRTAGRAARRAAPAWHASRHAHGRPASSEGRADRTLWPPATRIRAALLRAASGTRTHTARARMGGEPVGVLQAGATHR